MSNEQPGFCDSKPIVKCQSCGSEELTEIIDLGNHPSVNSFSKEREAVRTFPLILQSCEECGLKQLTCEVAPSILFPATYPYRTGTTKLLRENFEELAAEIRWMGSSVLEIGSNDGTMLAHLTDLKHLGIDPSDACDDARRKGVKVKQAYFTANLAQELHSEFGKFAIISASNCFAHMPDVEDLMRGVDLLLEEEGVFITESHYFADLVETLQYDTIYHEHLRYYELGSLSAIFKQHGFKVFDVKRIKSHGGSIRVYACREEDYNPINLRVKEMLREEEKIDLGNFALKVLASKMNLLGTLMHLRASCQNVAALGAPSRAATLINYTGIADYISYVMELPSSPKCNSYMPGTSLPVISEDEGLAHRPDYILLLSWHLKDELMPKLRAKGFKGKFIVPLPTVEIVE